MDQHLQLLKPEATNRTLQEEDGDEVGGRHKHRAREDGRRGQDSREVAYLRSRLPFACTDTGASKVMRPFPFVRLSAHHLAVAAITKSRSSPQAPKICTTIRRLPQNHVLENGLCETRPSFNVNIRKCSCESRVTVTHEATVASTCRHGRIFASGCCHVSDPNFRSADGQKYAKENVS